MRKTFILAIFSFAVAGVMMIASPASAIHKGAGALTCGNCHTMHSSQGGTNLPSMGGETGSFLLFRNGNVTDRSNVHLLCLQCHADDGSQGGVVYPPFNTTPPKVMLNDNPWDGVSFTSVGAGGDFSYIGTYDGSSLTLGGNGSGDEDMAVGKGHSIGISGATPPGNATAVAGAGSNQGTALNTFSCTSCHDSHGTDVTNNNINTYRNLRGGTVMSANNAENWWGNMSDFGDLGNSPFGGTTKSFCLNSVNACGTDDAAAGNVWPVYASATRENTYYFDTASPVVDGGALAAAIDYVGISLFCAQCHGAWHEEISTGNGETNSDWRRHPVNNPIGDGTPLSGGGITITDWTHYSSGTGITDGVNRVPAANAAGGFNQYTADASTDMVFCLSCHFAHGSKYYDILRWDYTSAVASGSQTGRGVASNVGCQQCHNR